ncbi:hypothetical protein CRG98_002930 [Punica granatum]|uniref:Reverse transcriptase domain-containing protein n=1 Tax=Punica granatum TaxID=22663 RepID=A0A2I0L7F8_PUNGR|nr:hypothetical protein CRG98_002930 [Punica granatum]
MASMPNFSSLPGTSLEGISHGPLETSSLARDRLKTFLPNFISLTQCAFVEGRDIGDNIQLVHELVKGYQRTRISPRCVIKADIMKAFDSVDWKFILNILKVIEVPDQFARWIEACTTGDRYSISVNGSLESYFKGGKGQLKRADYPIIPPVPRHGALPVRYHGVPLIPGRLQLIESVLYSLLNFWCRAFILPKKLIRIVENKCKSFLWRGMDSNAAGKAKIAWDTICLPKNEGGLGIKRLAVWNNACIMRFIWLIISGAGSLWIPSFYAYRITGRISGSGLSLHGNGEIIEEQARIDFILSDVSPSTERTLVKIKAAVQYRLCGVKGLEQKVTNARQKQMLLNWVA